MEMIASSCVFFFFFGLADLLWDMKVTFHLRFCLSEFFKSFFFPSNRAANQPELPVASDVINTEQKKAEFNLTAAGWKNGIKRNAHKTDRVHINEQTFCQSISEHLCAFTSISARIPVYSISSTSFTHIKTNTVQHASCVKGSKMSLFCTFSCAERWNESFCGPLHWFDRLLLAADNGPDRSNKSCIVLYSSHTPTHTNTHPSLWVTTPDAIPGNRESSVFPS